MITGHDKESDSWLKRDRNSDRLLDNKENASANNTVNDHYHFILSHILNPEFKNLVSWQNLGFEHVEIDEQTLSKPTMNNFIILVALKMQQLIQDNAENDALIHSLVR